MKITTVLLAVATLPVLLSAAPVSAKNILCFFASWAINRPGNGQFDVDFIDTSLCTHIYYGFVGITAEGNLVVNDEEVFADFTKLSEGNSDLKLLVSLGSWNESSQNFSTVIADPEKRKILSNNVVKLLEENKLQGFDIDWDWDKQRDPANFVELIKELKAALTPGGYLLSAIVSGQVGSSEVASSVPDLNKILDIISVRSFDYHGSFEPFVAHPAPLFASSKDDARNATLNVKSGIEQWIDEGADPAKVHLGVATYGRTFTLADPTNAELFAPIQGAGTAGPYTLEAGVLGYNEICELYQDWKYIWDVEQQVPHKVYGNQWVGYDDEKSLSLKAKYANENSLGGVMVWSMSSDDFRDICGRGKFPLINSIKKTLDS